MKNQAHFWLRRQIAIMLEHKNSINEVRRAIPALILQMRPLDVAQDVFLGTSEEVGDAMRRIQLRSQISSQLSTLPRGTWACLRWRSGEKILYRAIMAAGEGRVGHPHAVTRFETMPSYSQVWEELATAEGLEIIDEVLAEQKQLRNIESIQRLGLAAGTKMKDVLVSGTRYSTLVIQSVKTEGRHAGMVIASATIKGTRTAVRVELEAGKLQTSQ